jgi:hypothetical protein
MTRIDWLAAIQRVLRRGENAEHAKNAGSTGSTTCNSLKINDLPEPADGTHEFSLGVPRVPVSVGGTPGTPGILLGVPFAEGENDLKIQRLVTTEPLEPLEPIILATAGKFRARTLAPRPGS